MIWMTRNKIPILITAFIIRFLMSFAEVYFGYHGFIAMIREILYCIFLCTLLVIFVKQDDKGKRKNRIRYAIGYFAIEALVLPILFIYLLCLNLHLPVSVYIRDLTFWSYVIKSIAYGIVFLLYAARKKDDPKWFYISLSICIGFSIVDILPYILLYRILRLFMITSYILDFFTYVPAFCSISQIKVKRAYDSQYQYLEMYKNNMKK